MAAQDLSAPTAVDVDGPYMAQDSHLRYRSMTTLLQHLSRTSPQILRGKRVIVKTHEDEFLAAHSNALVRNHEVVAILPVRQTNTETQVVVTSNPRYSEHSKTSGAYYTLQASKQDRTSFTFSAGIVDFFLANVGKDMDIPFEDHCHLYLKLVKATYEAQNQAGWEKACARLKDYVYLSSAPKILRRFQTGMPNRHKNIFTVLTDDLSTTPAERLEQPDYSSALSKDLPNKQQMLFLRGMFPSKDFVAQPVYDLDGRMRCQDMLSRICEVAYESISDLDTQWKALRKKQRPDTQVLKMSIGGALQRAVHNMKVLSRFRQAFSKQLGEHLKWLAAVHEVRDTSLVRRPSVVTLSSSEESRTGREARPAASDSFLSSADSPSGSGGDGFGSENVGDGKAGDLLPSEGGSSAAEPSISNIDLEEVEDEDHEIDPHEVEDEDRELDDEELRSLVLQRNDSAWPAVAEKYMKLVCLHEDAVHQVCAREPGKKQSKRERMEHGFIKKLRLTTIQVAPNQPDQRMPSVRETLRKMFESEEAEVVDNLIERLVETERLTQQQLDDTLFKGTWHCETILLSLFSLTKELWAADDVQLQAEGVFMLKADLVRLFEHARPLIAISKRCCPACHSLIDTLGQMNVFKLPLIYPGYHTAWSGVALPPWLPSKYARAMYDHAVEVARQELHDVLEESRDEVALVQRRRKSPSESSEVGQSPTESMWPIKGPPFSKINKHDIRFN